MPEKTQRITKRQLQEQLAKKEEEAKENYDKFLRTLADLENYKKRVVREKEEIIQFSNEMFILEILPVLDNLERAVEAAQHGSSADPDKLVEGISMTLRQLERVLEQQGVKPIKAVGEPFDPAIHEAIMQKETAQHDDGLVLEELQKGYMIKSKLLRPARVKIAKRVEPECKSKKEE